MPRRILADIGDGITGRAFLEVPSSRDILDIVTPAGITVTWLPRDSADHGELLIPRVLEYLGTRHHESVPDEEVDAELWETPTFSSSEEELDARASTTIPNLYVWVAGESKVVTTLRRHLVKDLGIDRAQVSCMGTGDAECPCEGEGHGVRRCWNDRFREPRVPPAPACPPMLAGLALVARWGKHDVVEMHLGELLVTSALVSRLVADQFPDLASLPVERVSGAGTVNAIFRVGQGLAARFPLQSADINAAHAAISNEVAAAREFAGIVDCPIPVPVSIGRPGFGYPMPWLLQTWLPGRTASAQAAENGDALARDVALLIGQLRQADTRGRPFSGRGRGGNLQTHDAWIDRCLAESQGLLDTHRARALWGWFKELPAAKTLVMSHTDLIPANLLVQEGRLTGVLDSGGFGPADPALDLVAAWHLFDAGPRQVLRAELASSSTEWARGAAWAFQQAMGLVWFYKTSNPTMSELGRSTLDRIFSATAQSERGLVQTIE